MAITGTCHCGAISFVLATQPEWMTECNCTLCRRIGALWAHAPTEQITITAPPGATLRYIQGTQTLAVHSCKTCGGTTHWENLNPSDDAVMAVNLRMADPAVTQHLRLRHFDGADSWRFID